VKLQAVLDYITLLEKGSFDSWTEEAKRSYLTACTSIKTRIQDLSSPMRCIISYWAGSEFERSQVTLPVECESVEQLYCTFTETAQQAHAENRFNFIVGGEPFNVSDFMQDGQWYWPTIYTVEEWFAQAPEGKIVLEIPKKQD